MLNCEICKKRKVYVCSDNMNAWCQNGCGNYFHEEGILIYIGKFNCDYLVREDGSIRNVKRIEKGNKVIIEEERLVKIEEKIKSILQNKKEKIELENDCFGWFHNLSKEEKLEFYLKNKSNNDTSQDKLKEENKQSVVEDRK